MVARIRHVALIYIRIYEGIKYINPSYRRSLCLSLPGQDVAWRGDAPSESILQLLARVAGGTLNARHDLN